MTQPRRITDPSDCAAVLDLIRSAFAGMDGRIDPPSSMHALTVEAVADQARTGEVWAIGAPPVACMFLSLRGTGLYLGKLAVAGDQRHRGLARSLVRLAEDRARALGATHVELQTRVELTENHAVFRALGFRQTGSGAHPGYDRITTLTFAKPV